MSEQQPQTYWEKRCLINEDVLDLILILIENHFPHVETQGIRNSWQHAIDELDIQDWE